MESKRGAWPRNSKAYFRVHNLCPAAGLLGDPSRLAPVLQEVHRQVNRKSGDAEHMSHLQKIYYRAGGMQPVWHSGLFLKIAESFIE